MKVLITGGSGFIGKNLVYYLRDKHEILSPTHSELELTDAEAVSSFLREHPVDVVIHAANVGGKRKDVGRTGVIRTNLRIFFNLQENSQYFKKMIFLGSGAEYDKSADIRKVKESEFGNRVPEDEYGFYKFVCSKFIERSDNIVNLRIFGVFGKYEDQEVRFISNMICRAMFDLPLEINQNMFLDYVYVEDLCKIIDYFIKNDVKGKFYNIGNGQHYDLLTIANKIKKIFGKDFRINVKKDGMNKEYTCDNSALIKELNGFKFTEIDDSIQTLYKWYLDNKENIDKESLLLY